MTVSYRSTITLVKCGLHCCGADSAALRIIELAATGVRLARCLGLLPLGLLPHGNALSFCR